MEACPYCHNNAWKLVASFDSRPEGETDFGLEPYRRTLWQCEACHHVINDHAYDLSGLYDADYWDRTYGGDRMASTFHRIMALPADKSDNRGRADFVHKTACDLNPAFSRSQGATLLDVGSGLAVFPAVMKEMGWLCTALDPDARGAAHATEVVGVEGLAADFRTLDSNRGFDLISFNKVLEHVEDPVAMLAHADRFLADGGLIYVELPDGEAAIKDSPLREEFFIEHYCAFSESSTSSLVEQAGFQVLKQERLIEPSSKYTLRAFAGRWP